MGDKFEFVSGDHLHIERYLSLDALAWIRAETSRRLAGRTGFGGVQFTDVGAGGIQVDLLNLCEPDKMRLCRATLAYDEVGEYRASGEGAVRKESLVDALVHWFDARIAELEKRGPLCEHDWSGAGGEMCLHRYRCGKCGATSLIDSSD